LQILCLSKFYEISLMNLEKIDKRNALNCLGASAWILLKIFSPLPAIAQVVPDNSLPNSSIVSPNCTDCEITGGTAAGSNLFHSFEQFSIPTGGRAFFNHPTNIQNIFTRITGRSPSIIDGILQAGTANLFLLNPNGIIFGRNSSLDIGGSFFATTAEQIDFADGTQFTTVNPQPSQLLTISTPIGLQFGQNLATITNRSQSFRSQSFINEPFNTLDAPAGLQVATEQTLALISNNIILDGGNLTARSGRVELGSVAPKSRVNLMSTATSYDLTYPEVQEFADVQISGGSYIDTSGEATGLQGEGGVIQVQGRNILLTEEASVVSSTFQGTGADIEFLASGSIQLRSGSVIATFAEPGTGAAGNLMIQSNDSVKLRGASTALNALTLGDSTGNAGDISIETGELWLRGGARIRASTFGAGRGGEIRILADTIEIAGSNRLGTRTSAIFSQVTDNAGTIGRTSGEMRINTRRLTLQNGGVISTATYGRGNGGTLIINATESIAISGTTLAVERNQYRSGIFTSAEPGAIGNVGRLRITTDRLTITDRAEISANNRGTGVPGTARINVNQLTLQSGGEIRAGSPELPDHILIPNQGDGGRLMVNANNIQVTGTGTIDSENFPSAIAAFSESSGDAGDLEITTTSLDVLNGGEISVSGRSTGAAGELQITADRINLDRGSLAASTKAGRGGEIFLTDVNLLTLNNNSTLSARATSQAAGGNITITAPNGFVIATGTNNDIIATAVDGTGGNIEIAAQSILGLTERSTPTNITSDIDASSDFGAPGSVNINQVNPNPSQGAIELPIDIIDASSLVSQTCSARGAVTRTLGEFIITGRGGLAPSPTDLRNAIFSSPRWISAPAHQSTVSPEPSTHAPERSPTPPIVEAQGWIKTAQGEVRLVAETAAIAPAAPMRVDCDRTQ
jgi:filamentous hemagglutinin family protein